MTLGPSRVMEELVDLDDDDPVWDSAAEKSQSATPVAEVGVGRSAAPPARLRLKETGRTSVRGRTARSSPSPAPPRAARTAPGAAWRSRASPKTPSRSSGRDIAGPVRRGDTTDEDVDETGTARRGRVIQRVGSDPSMGAVVGAVEVDTAKANAAATDAEERARMAIYLDNDEEEDVPAHALPVFNRSNASGSGSGDEGSYGKARMSFVGFYKNEKGQGLEQARIFSWPGMSTACPGP